jgi:hypothetical protein
MTPQTEADVKPLSAVTSFDGLDSTFDGDDGNLDGIPPRDLKPGRTMNMVGQ